MEMWISKYALTAGIEKADGELSDTGYFYRSSGYWPSFKVGRDAHATLEEANASAEAARVKKIKSLKKQIEALEKLQFTT